MTDFQQFAPQSGTSEPGRDVTAVMGRRIAAWVVDLLIFIGLSVAMFAVQSEYVDLSSSTAAFGDACSQLQDQYGDLASGCFEVNDRAYIITAEESAVQTGASFAYLLVFILLQGVAGGSPGKLLVGLRVVKEDGTKAGVGRSFVRTLLWVVDGAPWFAPLVGFIVGLTSTGHRRVGDLVAKTYVIANKDTGAPVRTNAAAAPTGESAWGAAPPPPQWATPAAPPPQPPGGPTPGPESWTTTPTPSAPEPEAPELASGYWSAGSPSTPAASTSDDPPAEPTEPAPLPAEPNSWEPSQPTAEASPPADEPSVEAAGPSIESSTPADVAAPDVGHDPDWYRGPESDGASPSPDRDDVPNTEPIIEAPDTSEPETWTPTDPATEWSPPTTPTADITTGDDIAPTPTPAPAPSPAPASADPTGFVAPGSEAPPAPPSAPPQPPAQPPTRSLPQFSQAAAPPPPQWDQARNTYIQWDPSQQAWLQWDSIANRWKPIDT